MAVLVEKTSMARKKGSGRPAKPSGEGKAVRLDPGLASMARAVATSRGMSTGDYLAGFIEHPVKRDYKALLDSLANDVEKRSDCSQPSVDSAPGIAEA